MKEGRESGRKRTLFICFNPIVCIFLSLIFSSCSPFNFNLKPYNFGVVNEGEIYRSSQPDEKFLLYLVKRYNIRTIVILKGRVEDFEKKFANENKISIYVLGLSIHREPSMDLIEEFLKIIKNKENYPILIHCRGGADRTGLMVAIKRIEIDKWDLREALKEMAYYRNLYVFYPVQRNYLQKKK